MRKPVTRWAFIALAAACSPDIEKTPAPTNALVVARFDPGASPAVVPTPNDIGSIASRGQVTLPTPADPSALDIEFVNYVNGLGGFPASTSGSVTFNGELDAASVTNESIRVVDLTEGGEAVTGYRVGYAVSPDPRNDQKSKITITPPPGGWLLGHRYAAAVLGGGSAPVKSASGGRVVGTPAWALVRASGSLVECTGETLSAESCVAATEAITVTSTTPDAIRAERNGKAVSLEGLRRTYAPMIEAIGVPRSDIALLWSFNIAADGVAFAFDPGSVPANVPTPNDLAINPETGLVNAPIDPTSSPAQQEFTRDYLNTLNGFPVSASGATLISGADLDAASVTAQNIIVLDVTTGTPTPVETIVSYNAAARAIVVVPAASGVQTTWPKAHRYAIAAFSSPTAGVRTITGGQVRASLPWVLARSANSLVTCEDLADPDCLPAIKATTLEPATAVRLEQVRRGYAPLLTGLAAVNPALTRENIGVLWTFSTVNMGETPFNPAIGVVPFPNDLVRSPPFTGNVNVPLTGDTATDATIADLNLLNGFSLTGALVSENSIAAKALDGAYLIDEASVTGNVGIVNLNPNGGNTPDVIGCLNCTSSERVLTSLMLPQDDPQQLQIVPRTSLDENTQYGAYVTTSVRDNEGRGIMAGPIMALLRMENPLVDGAGNSLVSGVPNANAAALEPLRQAHKPYFDALAASGVPRSRVAMGWLFRTQSTVSRLAQIAARPAAASLTTSVAGSQDVTTPVKGAITGRGLQADSIGAVWSGAIEMPNFLSGPGGRLDLASTNSENASFYLFVPAAAAPSGGYPVVVFGHGLQRSKNDVLTIANSLNAAGFAVFATDFTLHGERSTCQTGNAAAAQCSGACVGGRCALGSYQAGSDGTPTNSGWNFLNLGLFAVTRDNWSHTTADLEQVVRVVKATGAGSVANAAGILLNSGSIHYVGQSLGGFNGALFSSVSTDLRRIVLNVPGSDQVDVLLTSPGFATIRNGFLAAQQSAGTPAGTPAFDQKLSIARWLIEPADPQTAIFTGVNAAEPADRSIFVQYITGDAVIPNSTTDDLIRAANQNASRQLTVRQFSPTETELATASRHGFLLNFTAPTLTVQAQTEVVNFLTTGTP